MNSGKTSTRKACGRDRIFVARFRNHDRAFRRARPALPELSIDRRRSETAALDPCRIVSANFRRPRGRTLPTGAPWRCEACVQASLAALQCRTTNWLCRLKSRSVGAAGRQSGVSIQRAHPAIVAEPRADAAHGAGAANRNVSGRYAMIGCPWSRPDCQRRGQLPRVPPTPDGSSQQRGPKRNFSPSDPNIRLALNR